MNHFLEIFERVDRYLGDLMAKAGLKIGRAFGNDIFLGALIMAVLLVMTFQLGKFVGELKARELICRNPVAIMGEAHPYKDGKNGASYPLRIIWPEACDQDQTGLEKKDAGAK